MVYMSIAVTIVFMFLKNKPLQSLLNIIIVINLILKKLTHQHIRAHVYAEKA